MVFFLSSHFLSIGCWPISRTMYLWCVRRISLWVSLSLNWQLILQVVLQINWIVHHGPWHKEGITQHRILGILSDFSHWSVESTDVNEHQVEVPYTRIVQPGKKKIGVLPDVDVMSLWGLILVPELAKLSLDLPEVSYHLITPCQWTILGSGKRCYLSTSQQT